MNHKLLTAKKTLRCFVMAGKYLAIKINHLESDYIGI
jgi:hypothetical protein